MNVNSWVDLAMPKQRGRPKIGQPPQPKPAPGQSKRAKVVAVLRQGMASRAEIEAATGLTTQQIYDCINDLKKNHAVGSTQVKYFLTDHHI
jgi:DNA invertase Pin-like site-specific DNA recombinase